jgi:hypothetical protein
MADDAKSAVYVSWGTFRNALDSLAEGIPNRIDRTTFQGLSGGVQAQLLAALKFLGLTDEESKPTSELHALAVTDEPKRKEKLRQILQVRYADLFALDLTKTTPGELSEKMASSYSVSGDTREKAIRFFLSAVAYVGVPVSRFLGGQPGSSGGASTPRRRRSTSRSRNGDNDQAEPEVKRTQANARDVRLKSGGTLTLTASVDFFQLSPEDRIFVFGLIDQLEKYKKENPDS